MPSEWPLLPGSRPTGSPYRRIAGSAAVTTVGIGGSVALGFLFVALWISPMGFAPPGGPGAGAGRPPTLWIIAVSLVAVLLPPFIGGGFWGWGIARLFQRPTRPAMRTGALAFGGMVALTAVPTDLTQVWLDDLPGWMPLDIHGYFTIVFMVEVGLVGLVASWRLARKLGAGRDAWGVGLWTAAAAAAGFFLGSIVAVGVGFRIFPWRHLSMVWAFLVSLPFSTLFSGGALGWRLQSVIGGASARTSIGG